MLGFGVGRQRKERLGLAVQSVNHILRNAVSSNGHEPHFPVGRAQVLDELVALGRCALGEMAQVERRDACDKSRWARLAGGFFMSLRSRKLGQCGDRAS